MPPTPSTDRTALVVAAGRGLGHAIAEQLTERGWHVIGTVRDPDAPSALRDLADTSEGRVEIETLDINDVDQIAALRRRLDGRALDLLFVNAGTTMREQDTPVGLADTDEFDHVMHTNALSPMRVIEALQDLVADDGIIGAMTSGQGSIANNERGGREVYRASKAALNQSMRSFAARQRDTARTVLVTAPGWVRTELGGDEAPYGIDETIPKLVDVMLAQTGTPGIQYLDWQGETVPW